MPKERMQLSEAIDRIRNAKRYLREGNIKKAIETTPCEGCKDKLRRLLDKKKGIKAL